MTQDETSYRAKGQAIFFAAIMVLSMVAASAAVGPAAALADDTDINTTQDVTTAGEDTGLEVQLSNVSGNSTGTGSIEALGLDLSDTITGKTANEPDLAALGGGDVNVTVDGTDVTDLVQSVTQYSIVADGTATELNADNANVAIQFEDSNGDPVAVDFSSADNVTIDIADGSLTNPTDTGDSDVIAHFYPDTATDAADSTTDTDGYSVTAPNVDVEPENAATSVGENATYTVSITDSNDDPIEGVNVAAVFDDRTNDETGILNVTISDGTTTESTSNVDANGQTVTSNIGSNADGELTFLVNSSVEKFGDDLVDITFTEQRATSGDATATLTVGDRGFVRGDVLTSDTEEPVPNADVIIQNTETNEFFNTTTDSDGFYQEEVPPGPYSVVIDDDDFESFSTTRDVSPGGTERIDVTLDRLITPDEIEVVNVDPSDSVDVENSIDVTVNVTSADFGGSTGQQALEGTPVEAGVSDSNVADLGTVDDVLINGSTANVTTDTNADGLATFSINVSANTTYDEIEDIVETTIRFDATEGDNVATTQSLTFAGEARSGDGFLSGDVDQFSNDLPVGAQSENAGAAEDVTVHAVGMDRVAENTNTSNASAGTNYVRVVNSTSGEVLDVQTDYLITPDNVELTANTSLPETGFNVVADSDTGTNFSVHVLEAGTYTVETSSNGTFTSPSTQTFTAANDLTYEAIDNRYEDVSAAQTDVTSADGEFVLANLYTNGTTGQDYAVIAADGNGNLGFANGAGYDTGVTVEQSSAPGQDDVALAVQQIEVDADAVDIENIGLLDSASEADDEYADSLTEFENTSDDARQVIPRDGSNVDVIDVSTFLEEGGDELGANVTLTYDNTSGTFDGAFLDAAVNGSVVSHSADEITVNTEDGNAVVFLETDDAGLNTDANVTIDAAMENAGGTDSTDKLFEGVLDQQYESGSITGVVSDANDNPVDARIFVNELVDEDAGVSVTFAPDDVNDLNSFTATVYDDTNPADGNVVETVNLTADEMRNFEFQNFDSDLSLASGEESFELFADRAADRTTLSPVPAVAADNGVSLSLTGVSQTGETGSSVSTAIEVNRTSTGSIVIEGVDDASFAVDNLDPQEFTAGADEVFNVSADVTNNGDLAGTQDIELRLNGSAADTQSLSLDAGATETVTFEVDASTIDAGTYEHSIASEDDEVTGTLTVEEANGSAESPVDGVTQEQFDAVLPNGTDTTLGELRASVGDWSDDEQVDGVSLTLGELRAIVDYWAANQ